MRTFGRIFMVALMLLALPAGAAFAQTTDGTVTVLHGIPGDGGFPVDIYVNGDYSAPFIPGLTFGEFAGPVTLAAADYSIEIYAAGADPASTDPALGPLPVTLPAGANATIEAHLEMISSLKTELQTFKNDPYIKEAGKEKEADAVTPDQAPAPADVQETKETE